MIPVKICGLTTVRDARCAASLGAEALGFIFYAPSPRFVAPGQARIIAGALDHPAKIVGVFVNTPPDMINSVVELVGLDLVQLSGDETPQDCHGISVPVVKTLHVGPAFDPAVARAYDVHAFLLDTSRAGFPGVGATGFTHDWNVSQKIVETVNIPVILAGGLNSGNVAAAIEKVRPWGVDSNTSTNVEGSRVEKDLDRIGAFVKAIKQSPYYSPEEK